jgi:hypothetical protein
MLTAGFGAGRIQDTEYRAEDQRPKPKGWMLEAGGHIWIYRA